MYKRILVPLDGSALSEAVLPNVNSLAQALDAEIILLHVIPEPSPDFAPPTPPLSPPAAIKKIQVEIKEYLKLVCSKLETDGSRATYLIRNGAVAEIILEIAETMQADIIAMSTHGRTGMLRLFMGSVAEQVVQHSPRLVALFRPQTK